MKFISDLDGPINGSKCIFASSIFLNLISYIVNRAEVEELPWINKLAFLKMLVCFVDFELKAFGEFPFTFKQVKTILKFVSAILKEQSQTALGVIECIDYLFY